MPLREPARPAGAEPSRPVMESQALGLDQDDCFLYQLERCIYGQHLGGVGHAHLLRLRIASPLRLRIASPPEYVKTRIRRPGSSRLPSTTPSPGAPRAENSGWRSR
ncbi:hypothetical protein DFAR_2040016 [Desulfarculales bacterium]